MVLGVRPDKECRPNGVEYQSCERQKKWIPVRVWNQAMYSAWLNEPFSDNQPIELQQPPEKKIKAELSEHKPEKIKIKKPEEKAMSKPIPPTEAEYWEKLENLEKLEPAAVVAFAQSTGKTMAQLQQDIQFVKHSTITGRGVTRIRNGQFL